MPWLACLVGSVEVYMFIPVLVTFTVFQVTLAPNWALYWQLRSSAYETGKKRDLLELYGDDLHQVYTAIVTPLHFISDLTEPMKLSNSERFVRFVWWWPPSSLHCYSHTTALFQWPYWTSVVTGSGKMKLKVVSFLGQFYAVEFESCAFCWICTYAVI